MKKEQKWETIQSLDNDIVAKSKCWQIPGMGWEDTAQELRLHLFNKLDKYDEERAGVRTFCVQVMNNKLKDLNKVEGRKTLNKSVMLGNNDISEDGNVIKKW